MPLRQLSSEFKGTRRCHQHGGQGEGRGAARAPPGASPPAFTRASASSRETSGVPERCRRALSSVSRVPFTRTLCHPQTFPCDGTHPPRLSAPSCSPTLPSPRGCACGLCCWRPHCTKPLHHAGGEHGEGPKPFGETHVSGSPLQHGAEQERGRPPSTRTVLPPLHSWKGYTTLFTYTTRNRAPRKEI